MLAEILEAVRAKLGVDAAAWLIGDYKRQQNARPPRYVWVPTGDAFGPPMRSQRHLRHLYTRIAGVECHLWGTSLADTEARLHALIAACHAVGNTSFELRGDEWDRAQVNEAGQLVIVSMAWRIPVTDATLTTDRTTTKATAIACDDSGDPPEGWVECCQE